MFWQLVNMWILTLLLFLNQFKLILTPEIYRIVSQKQLRDLSEDDGGGGGQTIRPSNGEPINLKPTVNTEAVRKQCCSN